MSNPSMNYMQSIKLAEINVDDVYIADYQRILKHHRVMKIVKDFDIHRMRPIEVNFRDGHYYCFDGQHRLNAYRIMGFEKIPAIIHTDCDYVREAMLFANQAENVRSVSNKDRWNAERMAGQREAVRICKICGDYGYTVADKHADKSYNIRCIASLQTIIRSENGEGALAWVMRMVYRCWRGLPHAVDCDIIDGLASFWYNYCGKMDEARLEKILRKVTPEVLIRDASKFRRGAYSRRDKRGIPVAKQIVLLYNAGYRVTSSKRLDDKYIAC